MARCARMWPLDSEIIRAIYCRTEVLKGSAAEDIVILEFPTYEDARGVVSRLPISSGIEASPPER